MVMVVVVVVFAYLWDLQVVGAYLEDELFTIGSFFNKVMNGFK